MLREATLSLALGTDTSLTFSGRHDSASSIALDRVSSPFVVPCLYRSQIEQGVEYPVDRLVFGTTDLDEALTVDQAGLETESSIDALVALDGGKRKRKKKVYTKPKKIKHKHKKRSLALLEYYNIEASGKVKRLKTECNKCEVATYMADHPDRFTCGKCGHMLYRLTAKGERLPIPENKKPAVAAVAAAPTKAAAKGKKKK